ncbi:MAG: hypothetical protein GY943_17125 [Chloroflexi bacterium]|nr:hypothetical protein [Chloroflexota bacterium]
MKLFWKPIPVLSLLTCLVMTACSAIPFIAPQGPPATPTPPSDSLLLNVPIFEHSLAAGESVPGTRLTYVGRNGDAFDVQIDGLPATKKIADSFFWSGTVAPGIFANYNLRIVGEILGKLSTAGSIELVVFNPVPIEVESIPTENAATHFGPIAVSYQMPEGYQIPGSTLSYVGMETQAGNEMAKLSGLSGHPLLAFGDSLVWNGRLLDKTYIHYALRASSINEYGLTLTGTADLWIMP